MRLAILCASFLLMGMSCLPQPDSPEDGFVLAYKSASILAQSARELCAAQHPDPCTGVLPTDVRDTMKRQLTDALDALDAARDQYFANGDDTGLANAERLLAAVSAMIEVYE